MADDVFVGVIDLFRIAILGRAEGDQAAGELLGCEAVGIANLVVELFKTFERGVDLDEFHFKLGARQEEGFELTPSP
jgi:hypothetical protein